MDALLVLGLLALALTLYWPQVVVGRVLEREARVVDEIRVLSEALEAHRESAATDVDGDGVGEYPALSVVAGKDPERYRPTRDPATFLCAGYYFTLRLPGTTYTAVRPQSKRVLVDGTEATCLLVAWPEDPGESGMRAYAWTPVDGILKHTVDGYPHEGRSSPPPLQGALLERVAGTLRATPNDDPKWVHPK